LIVVEKGEDASSFQCSESVNEQSTLKPEPLESVTLSQRFTKRTGVCRLFGAEFVATGHPPALLSQIPHGGFVAEDILPQKAAQTI
jgi:hypothetical protein